MRKAPLINKKRKRKIKDSIPQRVLFIELTKRVPHSNHSLRYNFPVRTWKDIDGFRKYNLRFVDVAHKQLKLAFEYDGEKWHTQIKDEKRDEELIRAGWKVIHINKNNFQKVIDNITKIIKERDKEIGYSKSFFDVMANRNV